MICSELGIWIMTSHISKSARIVGDTMGKYHPHGDSSIYDALVVMAQDFKKGLASGGRARKLRLHRRRRCCGHALYGGKAAERCTQEAFLEDLDKDVVDFVPNFDETEKEPVVLPVKYARTFW